MGARTADKLKEIEDLRAGLESKLGELEKRFPMAGMGRKAAAALAGTSATGTALAFAFRRVRGRRGGRARKRKGGEAAQPSVVVNVFPKGAAWMAAAGLAAWAGIKAYESIQKKNRSGKDDSFKPSVVPMPESGRQTP